MYSGIGHGSSGKYKCFKAEYGRNKIAERISEAMFKINRCS